MLTSGLEICASSLGGSSAEYATTLVTSPRAANRSTNLEASSAYAVYVMLMPFR